MTDIKIMTDLLVIFGISIGVVFIFHKFRLPPIAGFLAAGALITIVFAAALWPARAATSIQPVDALRSE